MGPPLTTIHHLLRKIAATCILVYVFDSSLTPAAKADFLIVPEPVLSRSSEKFRNTSWFACPETIDNRILGGAKEALHGIPEEVRPGRGRGAGA